MGRVKYYFKYLRLVFVGLLLISFSFNAVAQEDDDCSFDPNCEIDPDEQIPLDSGVIYLVAIGCAFAAVLVKKNSGRGRAVGDTAEGQD